MSSPFLKMKELEDMTLPKVLKRNYEKYGDNKVAYRKKYRGIWKSYTWKDVFENVKYCCLGLISLGLNKRDRVLIIGDNDPEWIFSELAIISANAVMIGAWPNSNAQELKFIIENLGVRFLIVKDQEQVDKVLRIISDFPNIKKVIYWDIKGLLNYSEPFLLKYKDLIELGKKYESISPGMFEENIEQSCPDDVCMVCYTSGTTGTPKGAMIVTKGIIRLAWEWHQVSPLYEKDELVSFVPLPWIVEQVLTVVYGSLLAVAVINFPETPETVQDNIREIGISQGLFSPRMLENQISAFQIKIKETTFLKRLVYQLCVPIGYKMADCKLNKQNPSFWLKLFNKIADQLLFKPMKDKFGLSKSKSIFTGGQLIAAELIRFYMAIGVCLRILYIITEGGGIITCHRKHDIKLETAGEPLPGIEIKISENGEILIKNIGIFKGYFNNDIGTKEVFAGDYIRTGDVGFIDEDNHLVVFDRIQDVMILKHGVNFSPQYLETKLKTSPYILNAIIFGNNREYISVLIVIDGTTTMKWAKDRSIKFNAYSDLSQKPEVYELIKSEIININQTILPDFRIRRFSILYKELSLEDENLSRTTKFRRKIMAHKYHLVEEAVYNGINEIRFESEIKYGDGRRVIVNLPIKIITT